MIRVLQQTGMDWFQVCCCDWFGVMIELRRILYTSMERMGSCRVISILEYVFLPMTDTITSVFHDSSSISKNERDKRGVHLPYSLLLNSPSYRNQHNCHTLIPHLFQKLQISAFTLGEWYLPVRTIIQYLPVYHFIVSNCIMNSSSSPSLLVMAVL